MKTITLPTPSFEEIESTLERHSHIYIVGMTKKGQFQPLATPKFKSINTANEWIDESINDPKYKHYLGMAVMKAECRLTYIL